MANDSPNVHILHTHDDIVVIAQEGSVEVDNIFGIAIVHNLKFTNDTAPHFFLGFDVDHLVKRGISNYAESFVMYEPTFLAMIVPVAICLTLLTVPPFP